MKKLIAILCLLAICLPLCACGGGSLTVEETVTADPTAEEKKTEEKESEQNASAGLRKMLEIKDRA